MEHQTFYYTVLMVAQLPWFCLMAGNVVCSDKTLPLNSYVFQKVINYRCKWQELHSIPGYTQYLILNRFCHFSGILLPSTKVKPFGVRGSLWPKNWKSLAFCQTVGIGITRKQTIAKLSPSWQVHLQSSWNESSLIITRRPTQPSTQAHFKFAQ